MSYLGNPPAEAFTTTVKDSFDGDGSTTGFTMSQPSVTNDVRVVVENVVQDPTVAYTCAGTTLTFTSAPPSGTDNIYVVHLGPAIQTAQPPAEIANATSFLSSVTVQGAFTSLGIDDNATSNTMTLNSSGNVGIGTSSPSDNVEINTSADGKGLTIKNAGNNRPYLNFDSNRSAAGNNLAQMNFKWNGTDVARIIAVAGSDTTNKDDGYLTFATSSTGSVDERMRIESNAVRFSTDEVTPTGTGKDFGSPTYQWRDIFLSGGVYLGGTGSANKLDDYEEGTFTPTFTPDTSGSLPLQNAYDTMQYVKIGNWVTLSGFIRAATPSSPVGSSPTIGNFPFTVANLADAAGRSTGSVSYFDDSAGNWSVLPVYIIESQTQAVVKIDSSTIGNNDGFYISFNYRTT
jgi:hypothetical protein